MSLPRLIARHGSIIGVQQLVAFFRKNPQAFVLLVICLVLGIATFLAVVIGLIGAGSIKVTGEPSGTIQAALRHAAGLATLGA